MRRSRLTPLYSGLMALGLGLICMLPAMIQFGGFFAIRGDYVNQTITRLITAKNMLSCGAAPLWNWKNFLGSAYTGALSTLFSLNSVAMLFPVRLMPFAAQLVLLLRWFLCGFTSCLLIRRFVKKDGSAMLGSLLYCFSGYAFAALEFSSFFASMAVFPLLILAVEMRFRDNSRFLLIPAAAVNLLASTYLFIGSSLALLVYSLIRFFTAEEWRKNRRASQVLLCLAEYFIGVLICGPKLLGFASSMLSTSRAGALIDQTVGSSTRLSLLIRPIHLFDVISGLFMPAASNRVTTFFRDTDWHSMQACLPVFGFGLCIAAFARCKLHSSLNKVLAAMLVISVIPLFNNASSFYGNWYTRWWYALTLVMAMISARVYDEIDEPGMQKPLRAGALLQWAAAVLIPALFYAAYLMRDTGIGVIKTVIALFFLHDYSFGFAEDLFRIFSVAAAVLFTSAFTCLVFIKKLRRYVLPVTALCIAVYGAAFVALNNSDSPLFGELLGDPKTENGYFTVSETVEKYYKSGKPEGGLPYSFRVDSPDLLINYAAVADQPSDRFFESTVDSDAAAFAEFADMGSMKDVHFGPTDNGNAVRTLLSVRYFYNYLHGDGGVEIPEGFEYVRIENGVDVYENEYFLPFGFGYDSYITESELYSLEGAGAELMLHTLVVEDGAEKTVSRILPHCGSLTPDPAADIAARRACSSSSFAGDPSGFDAEIAAQNDTFVFFSVPYDEGWSIKVDGAACPAIRANIGFMAVEVPAGTHSIHAEYHNRALYYGLGACALGLVSAAVYVLIARRKRGADPAQNA